MSDDETDIIDTLTHDEEDEVYRATFDSTAVAPSKAVIAVIAAIEDEARTQLAPLYDVVNADALDKICSERFPGRYDSDRMVEFNYHGYDIRVWSYGTVVARRADVEDVDETA